MDTIPADVFRYIFTLIPRAFKFRSVCKEWKHRLSERMFIYLWERQWVKSGVHLQWVEFNEKIFKKGWFEKTLDIGTEHYRIPYNGYHFESFDECNYYILGILKHTFTINNYWIRSGNVYFRMEWRNPGLLETIPRYNVCTDGFHVTQKQTWMRITDKKTGKDKACKTL